MKLSEMLLEWATENEAHDGEPCHCDFCQRFIPIAINYENALLNQDDLVMTLQATGNEECNSCGDEFDKWQTMVFVDDAGWLCESCAFNYLFGELLEPLPV